MDNPGYVALSRQSGLWREMQVIANNIANASTTGFRRESVIFSEFVRELDDAEPSLAMTSGNAHHTWLNQAPLTLTGNSLDLAIEGEGFFQIETDRGLRLTRAGHFTLSETGLVVTSEGFRLLDEGGSPIQAPPQANLAVARDGTISADGEPIGRISAVMPEDLTELRRDSGTMHLTEGELIEVENVSIRQGFLEESNVNPMHEIARMIEVQRAYEAGQKFLDREDERIRNVIQTISR